MSYKCAEYTANLYNGSYHAYQYTTELSQEEREKLTFIVQDALDFIESGESVIEICQFRIEKYERHKGNGEKLFADLKKKILDKNPKALIVIKAAPLMEDYPVEPEELEKTEEIKRQCAWLEKHGFVNINDYCGFENGVAYAYHNELADRILAWIKQYGNNHLPKKGD